VKEVSLVVVKQALLIAEDPVSMVGVKLALLVAVNLALRVGVKRGFDGS
jgi:hypothetical protein